MATQFVDDIKENYNSYSEAHSHLLSIRFKDLGWLNSGVKIPPHYNCSKKVYSNWSGSSCIYADPIYRVFYSVDMGD